MHHRRVPSRATALFTAGLVGLAGVLGPRLAPWAAPDVVPGSIPDTLAFEVSYGRSAAQGAGVWHGRIEGPAPGRIIIRLDYAGDPRDRRMPIWPVNAWLRFSGDDSGSSFAAELSGTMNWSTGEMRVAGLVSDGARRDTAVEHRMRVTRPKLDGSATVVFYPRIAWAGRRPV